MEIILARLYSDAAFLEEFLAKPDSALAQYDLDAAERQGLLAIDRAGLRFACRSFARKRESRPASGMLRRLQSRLRALWPGIR